MTGCRASGTNTDLRLLRELVAIDTDSLRKSNYETMAKLLTDALSSIGAKTTTISPRAQDGKPRPNIIGRIDNGSKETLALNAHYDIVPVDKRDWKYDPFDVTVIGDKAFGRGTNDDKGGIVAALAAVKSARKAPNLEIFFTCDEESGSEFGMAAVAQTMRGKIKSSNALVLDGESIPSIGGSGGIGGSLVFKGKEFHAGFPFMAVNPIDAALPFLTELNQFKELVAEDVSKYTDAGTGRRPYGRFNITMMNGSVKENLIPGTLEVRFDMRCIPEGSVSEIVGRFRRYFDALKKKTRTKVIFKVLYKHEPYLTAEDSPIVKAAQEITGERELHASFGGNDGAYFVGLGVPAVSYGLFNESAHRANEYVSLREMERVERNVTRIIESFG